MDELLAEFLTETNESLDTVDNQLVKFEQEPNNAKILDNIFRLVHTIKGTCGFLGLPRLEALAHAAETLMGRFRDGAPVTPEAVSLILASLDRLKEILAQLEAEAQEPTGGDDDLIGELERMASDEAPAAGGPEPAMEEALPLQILERELKPGEVSLDDLERAFREAPGPDEMTDAAPVALAVSAAMAAAETGAPAETRAEKAARMPAAASQEAPREGAGKTQSIRVNVDTLEHLMTMVSELVLTRNQLLEIVRRHEESEFKAPLQRLSNVTAELQEGVMKTRMQPIGNAWQKLPRIVRDLAQELGKKIDFVTEGQDTELDRQVLELIKDPLTHMVRNSADHGLEVPADRAGAGKSETGTIRLSAYHEGGHIIIAIADDGRGLDAERIRAKVLAQGLASEAELDKMSEAQIHKYIFAPGFSTAAEVTSVSGRGVGMDVVRTNIEVIGGSIDLKSAPGKGTTFTIKIPLTLAIVAALIVEAGGHRFAIPQINVVELVRVQAESEHRIERIRDTPVLRLRSKLLPLVRLTSLLGIDETGEPAERGFIVVAQVGAQNFGIVVDGVFHTEEIVVKPMSGLLRQIAMFSGTTILGDGSVIMILDPNGLAQALSSEASEAARAEEARAEGNGPAAEGEVMSLLLFRAGSGEPKAVPLSLVTRLEEIDVSRIERVGGRELVQYRGHLMPLVRMQEEGAREEGGQPMLVFTDGDRSMGLAVDEILDIVEDRLEIEVTSRVAGRLGSAVIRGRASEVVDVGHYLPMAFPDWLERKDRGVSARRRVLLVDDSAFFRNMLGPVLKAAGYDVTACAGGAQAMAMIARGNRFDVVVSDIEMPEMDGFDLVRALRAGHDMPVVALSSHTDRGLIERGREAGFSDFVAKFDRQGLIAALKESVVDVEVAA